MTERVGLGAAETSGIGEILVSSRTFAEYRSMFALTGSDLRSRILDCPGGASGFTAEACAAGARARACDPLYGTPAEDFAGIVATNRRRAEDYVRSHPSEYEWTFFPGPAEYLEQRSVSAAAFVRDYRAHPSRYVGARLPALPFADRAFDLVLCSHLLFSYADRLDLEFHVAAIRQMTRVAAAEVRIFPVFSMGSQPLLDLDPLRARLAEHKITTSLTEVGYRFQRGEPIMLACNA